MTRWWFGWWFGLIHPGTANGLKEIHEAHRESAVALSSYTGRNADHWAVVSVSNMYGTNVAAYGKNTRLG